eukprot:CAMPEP_0172530486 /NCGR_PEP_ID=MMETSP1067-20121228/4207_1 /TAXON_ID=265564 ORGANISM="Thalassiosira punctigera, Strain Tpunct2005C2" /NCGR_SAMPLE_ID=MMETSP1067 /ASSEMBLY_ACC=CAM_ASM_000444 /LENGTH=265 /DNA_ID=CAMNT_0013314705 /DNA_START=386 /DNA_END=1183 /DNA_ORIENTATION=+
MRVIVNKRSPEGDCAAADATDDAEDINGSTDAITIANVLDVIGIEVYKFLLPKDLHLFSLANHHVFDEVSKGLIQACLRQLPPNFVCRGIDHTISFNTRHSFPEKGPLMDHLLGKIKTAELKMVGTESQTAEESLARAREVLSDKTSAKFYSHNSKLPVHLQLEFTSAGYHFDKDDKKLATSRSEYILSRMAKEGEMSHHIPTVKTWINYILSQNHVVAGTWFWSCRHRNLDFQGVEGKGVMISSPKTEDEEMEICWTRWTASTV